MSAALQREEVIALAEQVGPAEAARTYGLKAGTVRSWLSRAGRATDASATAVATQARLATTAERKAQLASDLLDDAQRLRAQLFAPVVEKVVASTKDGHFSEPTIVDVKLSRPKPSDQRQIMIALAVAIDKVQILTGEATERIEQLTGSVDPVQRRERALAVVRDLGTRAG